MDCPTAFAAGLATGVLLLAIVLGVATLVHDLWFGKPGAPK